MRLHGLSCELKTGEQSSQRARHGLELELRLLPSRGESGYFSCGVEIPHVCKSCKKQSCLQSCQLMSDNVAVISEIRRNS